MAIQQINGKTFRQNSAGQWFLWSDSAWRVTERPAPATGIHPYIPPTAEQIAADNAMGIAEYAAIMDQQIPKMREALQRADLSHTRSKRGFVHAYRYDSASPSGFMLICSLEESRFDVLADEMRGLVAAGALSPLSPTEAR